MRVANSVAANCLEHLRTSHNIYQQEVKLLFFAKHLFQAEQVDGLTEHQNFVWVSRVCDVDFTRQWDKDGTEQFGDHVDYRNVERE